MARLKAMVRSALEDRSPRFLLATIALAVVVSLVAGFAIGYKVDNSRGGGGKTAGKTHTKKPTGKPGHRTVRLMSAPLLIGGVFSSRARDLVVLDANRRPRHMGIGPKTRVALAEKAKGSDIVVGSRVLFAASKSSATTATEVVVLPSTARIGRPVTAVVPGTSMSLKNLTGPDTLITTTGAIVRKTRPSTRHSIGKGSKVIVNYFVVRGRRNAATYIVVLPNDTKFQ